MRRGRYNILLPNGEIKKYNVYINDYGNLFIFYEKEYKIVKRDKRYNGGWLWKIKIRKEAI